MTPTLYDSDSDGRYLEDDDGFVWALDEDELDQFDVAEACARVLDDEIVETIEDAPDIWHAIAIAEDELGKVLKKKTPRKFLIRHGILEPDKPNEPKDQT